MGTGTYYTVISVFPVSEITFYNQISNLKNGRNVPEKNFKGRLAVHLLLLSYIPGLQSVPAISPVHNRSLLCISKTGYVPANYQVQNLTFKCFIKQGLYMHSFGINRKKLCNSHPFIQ